MFNKLTDAETERLDILVEELAEAIQAAQKIKRHGYTSHNPFDAARITNRAFLETELGHVLCALNSMYDSLDVSMGRISRASAKKKKSIKPYLHHQ